MLHCCIFVKHNLLFCYIFFCLCYMYGLCDSLVVVWKIKLSARMASLVDKRKA